MTHEMKSNTLTDFTKQKEVPRHHRCRRYRNPSVTDNAGMFLGEEKIASATMPKKASAVVKSAWLNE